MADLVTVADVVERWPAFAKLPAGQQAMLISDVSGIIEGEYGYSLDGTSIVEHVDGTGYPRLWLRQWPVVSVESITVNGSAVDSSDYTLDPETGEIFYGTGYCNPRYASRWPFGRRNIVVSYTVADQVADAVKRAVALTIQYYAERPKATGLFKQEMLGDYQYTLADSSSSDTVPPAARAILGRLAKQDAFA